MKWAFKKPEERSLKESTRQKRYYDKKVKCSELQPGDMVLVRQKVFKGKHKIQDKWENTPYKVVEQINPNLPVFCVESTGDSNKTRVLHRNMLFPLLTHDLDQTQSSEDDVPEINSSDEESDSLDLEENPIKGL